jgi:UDP-2-acetamido-3-amino-2,3-dideoxy-glucuronate N-acetyltransferase
VSLRWLEKLWEVPMSTNDIYIHPSANVSDKASIGAGTKVWINVQIRENAVIGEGCILSKDVYIDYAVKIGRRCKIQNTVSVYNGVSIGDDVFVGPNVAFTNDRVPRAHNVDWKITPTLIENGASIGSNSTIICGVTIGEYSMVAAGSVVTRDVPPYTLVMGNPARPVGNIDKMGNRVAEQGGHDQ